MPTLSSIKLPPPKSWDEFEEITLTCLKIKWDSPNLTRHGRQGQSQAGVDIYGEDNLGRFVGVQCKKTDLELNTRIVKCEVAKAEQFVPPITTYYLATSLQSDVNLQKEIRLLSDEHIKQGKLPIGIFFWDDLIRELVKNKAEFSRHYPDFKLTDESYTGLGGARKLSLLDISYFGLNLKFYMALLFGDIGKISGEDPYQFASLTRAIDGCALIVLDAQKSTELISLTSELTHLSIALASGTAKLRVNWEKPNSIATTIEGIISSAQYSLTGKDLAAFTSGRLLGHWHRLDIDAKLLSEKVQEDLIRAIKALSIDGTILPEISEAFREYRSPDASLLYDYSHTVYAAVRRMLIEQEIGNEIYKSDKPEVG